MKGFGEVVLELGNLIPVQGQEKCVDVCVREDCEGHDGGST